MNDDRQASIELRATRGLRFEGNAYAGGATIKATPLQAAELLSGGRAVLTDESAMSLIAEAAKRQTLQQHREMERQQPAYPRGVFGFARGQFGR